MRWACGITTVPERRGSLFIRTLESLTRGGFGELRVFDDAEPKKGAYGNWLLGLIELWVRRPDAERFAMFQDDIICCRNLRLYLDAQKMPVDGYWNLYSAGANEPVAGDPVWRQGHFTSLSKGHQKGVGALALVFSRDVLLTLLRVPHTFDAAADPTFGRRSIDGKVATALNQAGFFEYVHNPSLVQHVGTESVIHPGKAHDPAGARTFPGENFDASELLPQGS